MLQRLCLIVALAVAPAVIAQTQPGSANQGQPSQNTTAGAPTGPSVYVVNGGLYGTSVYPSTYVPAAPSQNPAPPQAGTAGISFNTPATYNGPGYSYATPVYSSNPSSPYYNATPVVPGSETSTASESEKQAESGRQINDLGPSFYAGGTSAPAAQTPSVAEVAERYRAQKSHSTHVYTNEDASRLNNSVTVQGSPMNNNTAPQTEPPQNAQPPSQPQQSQPPKR